MNNNKSKFSFGLNIGSSSVLLVFVLLCLVFFAALSIISANADNKLSQKVLERTTAYYEACNEAELALAELDNALVDTYKNTAGKTAYFSKAGHEKSYSFPISDLQTLNVTVEIKYPTTNDDTFYQITSWKVITNETISE